MIIVNEKLPPTHKATTKSSVYGQLDVWRALAAIWVVMEHACSTVLSDTHVVPHATSFLLKNYIIFSLSGQLGVIMFFVISGYCIVLAADRAINKQKTPVDFLKARFRRIFPPYYASIALAVVLPLSFLAMAHLGLIPMPNHKVEFLNGSFVYYFANLTLTQDLLHVTPIQAIYWSLCYEVAFYVIVAICMFLNKTFKFDLHNLLFIITQLSLLWLIISPDTCPFPFGLWYLFGLGGLVYKLIQRPDDLVAKLFLGITGLSVLLFACFQKGHYSLGHPSSRTQAIFGLVFSAVILLLHRFDGILMNNRLVRIFAFLGTMSYSIYLSHTGVIAIPRQLMIKMGFIDDKYWVTFLVQIVVGIAFGYIFHIFCERPFMSAHAKVREDKIKV